MPEYIYLIHPFRDGFFEAPTPEENTAMDEHYQYLQAALEAGALVLAGPCLDETFGVVIFKADDDEAAQAFMFADPSVKKNVMMAELHPMRISLGNK
ncbi:MAG TPA: YciI family protein [Anaerolineales bacterium]|nr:YciI family protein [Anaerolineales bacterium]